MSFNSDSDPLILALPQAVSRFDPYFDVYGLSLKEDAGPLQRIITLIARSPASPPALALAVNLGRFQRSVISVRIIFAQIAPPNALDALLRALEAAGIEDPRSVIRWARDRALLEAHERLTLGRTLCWTGDSMRRMEDSRSAMDRVDDGTPEILAEADASFTALWGFSKPVPKTLFLQQGLHTPKSEGDRDGFASSATGPNIVRLDNYLRIRRH